MLRLANMRQFGWAIERVKGRVITKTHCSQWSIRLYVHLNFHHWVQFDRYVLSIIKACPDTDVALSIHSFSQSTAQVWTDGVFDSKSPEFEAVIKVGLKSLPKCFKEAGHRTAHYFKCRQMQRLFFSYWGHRKGWRCITNTKCFLSFPLLRISDMWHPWRSTSHFDHRQTIVSLLWWCTALRFG